MATINNAVKKSVTKVVLEPGMKIVLEQNGVPLTTEQLAGGCCPFSVVSEAAAPRTARGPHHRRPRGR